MKELKMIVLIVGIFFLGALAGSVKPPKIVEVDRVIFKEKKIYDFTQESGKIQTYADIAGFELWDKGEYDKYVSEEIETIEKKKQEVEDLHLTHIKEIENKAKDVNQKVELLRSKIWTAGYQEGYREAMRKE